MNKEKTSVPSVERTVLILEFLGDQLKPIPIKVISDSLKLPNASVFRIVKYLVKAGYITEHSGSVATYSLGLKILQLAYKTYNQLDLGKIAKKHMRQLADKTTQTCQLAVLFKDKVMYTDQAFPPSHPVSIIAPLCTPVPINTSAAGKVLYAYLEHDEREMLLGRAELANGTEKSIIDKDLFRTTLTEVIQNGYATDIEEFAIGIGCIAAPLFDHNGKVKAAIGLTGHIKEYNNPLLFSKLKAEIVAAATSISKEIGYSRD